MKRFIVLLFALSSVVCYAQNQKIKVDGEVKEMSSDLDAKIYFPKHDFNDRLCALIKVVPSAKLKNPLTLEVGGLGVVDRVEKASGEVWFYVPAQVKNLNFKCAGYDTPSAIPVAFKEGCVYQVKLSVVSSQPTQQVFVSDENAEHLVFKGVPIDGSLNQYVKEMQKAGFRQLSGRSGVGSATLTGDFAGFKDCTLQVSTISNHDLVCSIDVFFSVREKWSELYGDYSTLKSMLTQKYGKPASCEEKFQVNYSLDDNSKMYHAQFDNCKYITTYKTPKGTITLRIDNADLKCFVRLTYSDKTNSSLVRNTALSDL